LNQIPRQQPKKPIIANTHITRTLIHLSVPAMIGLLVNTLYTMVDMLFIGRIVGPLGIATLGISMPIYLFIIGIALMVGIGGASVISRQLGEGNSQDAGKTAMASILGILVVSIPMIALVLFGLAPISSFLGATAETQPLIHHYLSIMLWGSPCIVTATVLSSQLRAQGAVKHAMIANIIGNVLNIVLDYLLIIVCKWGVSGAALATVIGQGTASLYAFGYLHSSRSLVRFQRITAKEGRLLIRTIMMIGLPTLVRQLGTSIVTMTANRILLIHGGNAIVASFTLVMTVLMFFTMPSSALVQGMQPMVGFHYGAKHMHLVKQSYITAILCSIGVGSLFYLCILLFPQSIFSLFTHDSQLLRLAVPAGHMVLMGLPLLGIQSIGTAYFQSIGKGTPALVLWILRQFILLIPLIYALGSLRGAVGVYWAFPISDIISALVIFFVTARSVSALQQHHRKTSKL
jgi:putative MATE family efflux protein